MWDELVFDRITFLSGDRTRRPCTPARPLRADELVGLLNPRHTPAPNQIWDTAHQHARAFYDTHGHLDVPSRHQTPDGFYLGWWVGRQRSLKTHGMLLPQRRAALDLLGIQWEHPPTSIELSSTSHATTPAGTATSSPPAPPPTTASAWARGSPGAAPKRTATTCPTAAIAPAPRSTPGGTAPGTKPGSGAAPTPPSSPPHARTRCPSPTSAPNRPTTPTANGWPTRPPPCPASPPSSTNCSARSPCAAPSPTCCSQPRGYSAWAFRKGLREAYLFWRTHQHLAVPATYRGDDGDDPLLLRRWLSERRRNVTRLTTGQINEGLPLTVPVGSRPVRL
ncbi:helicase associated domain-containing protein [Streptomyces lasalocidi]